MLSCTSGCAIFILTSKFPDFLTHFMLHMTMMLRTRSSTTPVGLAIPATKPKTPGVEVISHSQADHLTEVGVEAEVRLVLTAQCGGGGTLFSTKNLAGSTSKLTTRI